MNKRVIIWGTGGVAKSAKDYYEAYGYSVVAFTDNNEKNWNTYIEDILVIPPSQIKSCTWDIVALGMFKYTEEVTEQLVNMGISRNVIKIPITERKLYKYPHNYSDEELIELNPDDYDSDAIKEYKKLKIKVEDAYFWGKLEVLKTEMKKNNIPLSKLCVVKGMCMVAYGCRHSKINEDMDIILTSDLRKIYGVGKIYVADGIEVSPYQYMFGRDDDEIINNPERHVVVNGIKFMRLSDMYTYKREMRIIQSYRPGLVEDLKLLHDYFKNHNLNYDYQKTEFANFMDI